MLSSMVGPILAASIHTVLETMTLTKLEDPNWNATFKYETPKSGLMIFKGELEGHQFEARMHRKDPSTFRLTNRGLHWVNEYPFNR